MSIYGSYYNDVIEFHEVFGSPFGEVLITDKEEVKLREKLVTEEYNEVLEAFRAKDPENLLKELCDLVYVTIGTAVAMGYNFDEAFERVHRSNMSKLGPDGPIVREDGKILKGPDYVKADLKDLIDESKQFVSSRRSPLSR